MKAANPSLDPLPPERVKEVGAEMLQGLARVLNAPTEEDAKREFVMMLGKAADVMTMPIFQRALVAGLSAGARAGAPLSGGALKGMRRDAGITQAQLAQRLGVSQGNVADWELGTRAIPAKHVAMIRVILATN
jgi:DNA-binding transcriptional regulator YiaG